MGNYGGPSPGDTVVTGVALAVKCIPHAAQTYAKNHHGDIVVEHPEVPFIEAISGFVTTGPPLLPGKTVASMRIVREFGV